MSQRFIHLGHTCIGVREVAPDIVRVVVVEHAKSKASAKWKAQQLLDSEGGRELGEKDCIAFICKAKQLWTKEKSK